MNECPTIFFVLKSNKYLDNIIWIYSNNQIFAKDCSPELKKIITASNRIALQSPQDLERKSVHLADDMLHKLYMMNPQSLAQENRNGPSFMMT